MSVRASGYFLFGVVAGAFGVLATQYVRRQAENEDVERLEKKVATHLRRLESRLDAVMSERAAEAV